MLELIASMWEHSVARSLFGWKSVWCTVLGAWEGRQRHERHQCQCPKGWPGVRRPRLRTHWQCDCWCFICESWDCGAEGHDAARCFKWPCRCARCRCHSPIVGDARPSEGTILFRARQEPTRWPWSKPSSFYLEWMHGLEGPSGQQCASPLHWIEISGWWVRRRILGQCQERTTSKQNSQLASVSCPEIQKLRFRMLTYLRTH